MVGGDGGDGALRGGGGELGDGALEVGAQPGGRRGPMRGGESVLIIDAAEAEERSDEGGDTVRRLAGGDLMSHWLPYLRLLVLRLERDIAAVLNKAVKSWGFDERRRSTLCGPAARGVARRAK